MKSKDHWTENEEILEEFALGRIEPAFRTELEEHLAGCPACRRKVEDERILAAGIRNAGARKTRETLDVLMKGNERNIPWPHILSMAAALVLIIGIGIYNRWLVRSIPPARTDVVIGEKKEQNEVPREQDEPAPTAGDYRRERMVEEAKEAEVSSELSPAPAVVGETSDLVPAGQASGAQATSYLLSGTLLRQDTAAASMKTFARESGQEANKLKSSREDAVYWKARPQPERNLVIHLARQEGVGDSAGRTLSCSLEEVDSLFHLTIFLDPGVSLTDSGVSAALASPDSLVVTGNGLLIGIVLPAAVRGRIIP